MAQAQTKASTQQHLDIQDITDNLVILKSQAVAMIMSTTAVNFDILSEAEQDATIYAYGAFLNSLSFPLQVLIRSKKADITTYYHHLEESMQNQPNPDLKAQIQKYMEFIQSTVQQKTILDKKFYFIINFSTIELGFKGLTKKSKNKNVTKAQLINDAKINLIPKRDHIIKQAARLGLTARQLTTKELIELFYDIYNPAPTGTQRIILDTASYTAPLVKPAVESPAPPPQSDVAGPPRREAGKSDLPPSNTAGTPDAPPPTISPQISQTISNQPPASKQQEALQSLQQASTSASDFINQRQQATNQSRQAPAPQQVIQKPNQPASQTPTQTNIRPVPPLKNDHET